MSEQQTINKYFKANKQIAANGRDVVSTESIESNQAPCLNSTLRENDVVDTLSNRERNKIHPSLWPRWFYRTPEDRIQGVLAEYVYCKPTEVRCASCGNNYSCDVIGEHELKCYGVERIKLRTQHIEELNRIKQLEADLIRLKERNNK